LCPQLYWTHSVILRFVSVGFMSFATLSMSGCTLDPFVRFPQPFASSEHCLTALICKSGDFNFLLCVSNILRHVCSSIRVCFNVSHLCLLNAAVRLPTLFVTSMLRSRLQRPGTCLRLHHDSYQLFQHCSTSSTRPSDLLIHLPDCSTDLHDGSSHRSVSRTVCIACMPTHASKLHACVRLAVIGVRLDHCHQELQQLVHDGHEHPIAANVLSAFGQPCLTWRRMCPCPYLSRGFSTSSACPQTLVVCYVALTTYFSFSGGHRAPSGLRGVAHTGSCSSSRISCGMLSCRIIIPSAHSTLLPVTDASALVCRSSRPTYPLSTFSAP